MKGWSTAPALASFFAALFLGACGGPESQPRPAPQPTIDVGARPPSARLAERARQVHERFDPARAMAVVGYVERHFRVRGNEGYQKTLERVRDELGEAGMDSVRTLQLGPVQPTWTPRSATLELIGSGEPQRLVHFDDESGVDRAALLVRSDATDVPELEVVTAEAVRGGADPRGKVILAVGEPGPLFRELVAPTGAAGLLVMNLESYHQADDHPDVAQFGYLPEHEAPAFGFSLSRRDHAALAGAIEGGARVRVRVDVAVGRSAATAIEARVAGTDPSAGAIVFVAHADEPGANDNASGVAALAELARALHVLVETGAVPRPRRSIVFLFGQEMEVSRTWLASPPIPVAAGLVLDMVGQDPEATGAPFLIERMPDPGAIWLRAPDAHTEWGAGSVEESQLRGHFLNDLMSASAAAVEALDGPWRWRTNPFEGGSDHVPFLDAEMPAVLGWHFTDDAYHTTRDRLDRVSPRELRRVAAVFGAVALTMANDDGDELVPIVAHGARVRLRDTYAASRELLSEGRSDVETETRVLAAWGRWYDEALGSTAPWGASSEEVASSRSRWGELVEAVTDTCRTPD